jgi:hypothetical protein
VICCGQYIQIIRPDILISRASAELDLIFQFELDPAVDTVSH